MTISLPPELESIVSRKIADGSFQSEEDVVRAALELLVSGEEEETERLRAWAAEGFADLRAGRKSRVSAEDIKRSARERFLG